MNTIILPEIVSAGVYNASMYQKGRDTTLPRRTTMFEIEFPIGLGGVSYIDDESIAIAEDLIICAKPGQLRHTRLPFKCYFVHMIVKDELLYDCLMKLPNYITVTEREQFEKLFLAICDTYDAGQTRNTLLLHSRLLELIYLLSGYLRGQAAKTGESNQEMIERVIALIKEDPSADLSLARLAEYASFSPIHFHNCFKRSTGMTLREYVEEQRLFRAIELLIGTDMTLSEIAYACGFSSQSYFNFVFKRNRGMTPREYVRKTQREYEK